MDISFVTKLFSIGQDTLNDSYGHYSCKIPQILVSIEGILPWLALFIYPSLKNIVDLNPEL